MNKSPLLLGTIIVIVTTTIIIGKVQCASGYWDATAPSSWLQPYHDQSRTSHSPGAPSVLSKQYTNSFNFTATIDDQQPLVDTSGKLYVVYNDSTQISCIDSTYVQQMVGGNSYEQSDGGTATIWTYTLDTNKYSMFSTSPIICDNVGFIYIGASLKCMDVQDCRDEILVLNMTSGTEVSVAPVNVTTITTMMYVPELHLLYFDSVENDSLTILAFNNSKNQLLWSHTFKNAKEITPFIIGPKYELYVAFLDTMTKLTQLECLDGKKGSLIHRLTLPAAPVLSGMTSKSFLLVYFPDREITWVLDHNSDRPVNVISGKVYAILHDDVIIATAPGLVRRGPLDTSVTGSWELEFSGIVKGVSISGNDTLYITVQGPYTDSFIVASADDGRIRWHHNWSFEATWTQITAPVIMHNQQVIFVMNSTLHYVGCCNGNGVCDLLGCKCDSVYFGETCSVMCNSITCGSNTYCDKNGSCLCNEFYYPPPSAHTNNSCSIYCNATPTCNGKGTCTIDGTCDCGSDGFFTNDSGPYCNQTSFNKRFYAVVFGGTGVVLVVIVLLAILMAIRRRMKGYRTIQ